MPVTGILGGTFDPVHRGHLSAATQLLGVADLAEVWLMPNAQPPHRTVPPVASAADRLRMVELAVDGIDGVRASAFEVERGGRSYTLDTLRALRRANPDRPLALLLGFDAALQIRAWHEADAVLREARFIVFSRPSVALKSAQLSELGFPPRATTRVQIETPPISARTIRERLSRGEPVDAMVVPAVAAYIRDHGLYPPHNRMG